MTEFSARIEELAERARRDREAFDPPADPPDEQAALEYARDGVGAAVALYIDARTGAGSPAEIEPAAFTQLERAMNDWIELYAACYGVDMDAEFTVRELAELLVDTHDIRETVLLVTGVPTRTD